MAFRQLGLVAVVLRFASRLRYRSLFVLFAVLFLSDLIVPDAVPFVDELLLGLGTLLLGSLKKKDSELPSDGDSDLPHSTS